jgi:hypothetical protein
MRQRDNQYHAACPAQLKRKKNVQRNRACKSQRIPNGDEGSSPADLLIQAT